MKESSQRYLRKRGSAGDGRPPFIYTELLAKRQDMIECDKEGNIIGAEVSEESEATRLQNELDRLQTELALLIEQLELKNACRGPRSRGARAARGR